MKLHEMILSRSSVRDFSEKQIEKEKLEIILEAGRQAPSAQNKQCWRYIVLEDRDNIKKFARHTGLIGGVNYFIGKAPVVIVACADPGRSVRLNSQDYYLVDTAISFHQMMLAAMSMGIGSCWLAAFSEPKVKDYLAIPKQIRVVGISPFGYPRDKTGKYTQAVKVFAGSNKRLSLDKIISYEKWSIK